jgi:outer membrane protein OmpA-like peptidoglycan-associated protein
MNSKAIIIYHLFISFFIITSCNNNTSIGNEKNLLDTVNEINEPLENTTDSINKPKKEIEFIDSKRQFIRLSHHINTSANEYLPVLDNNENKLFFSAMDRTGHFDFKLDFTKQASSGGEDLFYSKFNNGIWEDARPIEYLNTNGHEVISQVLNDNSLLITSNYTEKLGPRGATPETETSDLFKAKFIKNNKYQIIHFPEPVNSIFTEADAIINEEETSILFVSDRPGNIGEYHKKGLKWNSSFWGNTDVYVSLKNGDFWSPPINLGNIINSPAAERTPWLSNDELTLYLSSNGYVKDKNDLDIYCFKRKDKNNWTDWDGPFLIKDASTEYDDWGYKETKDGSAYLAKVMPLGFKPSQGGTAGDGYIRETNYRPGYTITGQQIASLNAEFTTDIYFLKKVDIPVFTMNDVFFEINSSKLNQKMLHTLERLVDLVKQNEKLSIEINGFTDDTGDEKFNLKLSQDRANSVKEFLINNNVKNKIITNGFGELKPKYNNSDQSKKALNRRVEIYFTDKEQKVLN